MSCERCEAAEQARARLEAEVTAKNSALEFAEGAISDAISTEDGLDGAAGEAVLHICQEARESGTFDQAQARDRDTLPSVVVQQQHEQIARLEAALAEAEGYIEHAPVCVYPSKPCDCGRDALAEKISALLTPTSGGQG